MAYIVNAGVIGCNMVEEFFELSRHNTMEKFNWKKVFSTNVSVQTQNAYPDAEFVSNVSALINDAEISLVFISSQHMDMIPLVMQAGKSVRIIKSNANY